MTALINILLFGVCLGANRVCEGMCKSGDCVSLQLKFPFQLEQTAGNSKDPTIPESVSFLVIVSEWQECKQPTSTGQLVFIFCKITASLVLISC